MTTAEIVELIATNKIVKFYKSPEWRELRAEVLRENCYECQRCLERGKYTRATMVHHVNEVRKRPDLALKKVYIDGDGQEQKQLLPLCFDCHEAEHDRLGDYRKKTSRPKYTNVERW